MGLGCSGKPVLPMVRGRGVKLQIQKSCQRSLWIVQSFHWPSSLTSFCISQQVAFVKNIQAAKVHFSYSFLTLLSLFCCLDKQFQSSNQFKHF